MGTLPSLPFIIYEIGAFIVWGICLVHAWRHGRHWVFVIFAAMLFGFLAEFYEVRQINSEYTYGRFLIMIDKVPLAISILWSVIIYAAMQTSNFLALPWFISPLYDTLLGLSIDLGTDPIASSCSVCLDAVPGVTSLDFWVWHVRGLWFDVPLDNFFGWFILIGTFSFFVRLGFRLFPPTTEKFIVDLIIPLLAVAASFFASALALNLYLLIDRVIPQTILLPIILGLALLVVLRYFSRAKHDHPIDPVILGTPFYFYLFYLGVLIFSDMLEYRPVLLLLWLVFFLISTTMFSAPYWRRLPFLKSV
jgi:uncharacterized membrane protein